MSTAHDLYARAGILLEGEDNQLEAIDCLEQALATFTQEQDGEGMCDVYRSLFLNHKHLYLKTGEDSFRVRAFEDMSKSLQMAEQYQLRHLLGRGHFGLGEAAMLFLNYEEATEQYREALEVYSGTMTERGDYRYHLGEALYRGGKKDEGKATMLEGLREIEDYRDEVDSFLANVWESGCHLKLAELLSSEVPEEAEVHFLKAKKIIDSDSRLVIRARQLNDLAKRLATFFI